MDVMGARQTGVGGLTAFVPNGDSRKDTAIILVGTARENGIDTRAIRATSGGFYISDELAELLSADESEAEQPEPEPEPEQPAKKTAKKSSSKKKTSGNRAAKNSTTEKE